MKDLEEIRGRCVLTEDGHWLWRGATRPDGRPNIYAPDYTYGDMRTQCGTRAVWHCSTGRPIPNGWRAYGTCDEKLCCNPAHVDCASEEKFGKWIAERGNLKGVTARILANRATGRARSKLSPELIAEIQSSQETGLELSARLKISSSVISKARRGNAMAFRSASPFSGLGAL